MTSEGLTGMTFGLTGRRVLFLQGPSSRFFQQAAAACRARGASVARLCLCPGDRLYWSRRLGPALHYRGRPEGFRGFLNDLLQRIDTTDVAMLGDGRAYHAAALDLLAETGGAQPWIIEHGYLRPGLILVETRGTGGASSAPGLFAANGSVGRAPPPPAPTGAAPASFLRYAALDVGFHAANLCAGWLTHPRYARHALDGPLREYAGWLGKALHYPARRRRTHRALDRIAGHGGPVFLLPLQLATDYQIRHHGTGAALPEVVAGIIDSFARADRPEALLAVKEHPLDNGLFDWAGLVASTAKRLGVEGRVVLLSGGDLGALLARCRGVVTVNSTVGLTALQAGVPCRVLGRAVYDLPGLTDRQALDGFWSAPAPPDPDLLARYVAFLRARFHIAGGFDGPAALEGARNLADRLARGPVDR
jgi:capsular polysaccharide export protein